MTALTDTPTATYRTLTPPAAPVVTSSDTATLALPTGPPFVSHLRSLTRQDVAALRSGLQPGRYLLFINDAHEPEIFPIRHEWVRIGRSLASDIRFEGAGMSRRHALIVAQPDGLRVVDDRSLNGVYVNGERVDWSALADGDELTLGQHVLYYVETGAAPADQPALGDPADQLSLAA